MFAPTCPHVINQRLATSNLSTLGRLAYLGTSATYYREFKQLWMQRAQDGVGSREEAAAAAFAAGCCSCSAPASAGQPQPSDEEAPLDEEEDEADPQKSVWAELAGSQGLLELAVPQLGRSLTGATRLHIFPGS